MNIHKRELTKRETQIFKHITAGKTNSEIAERLEISVKTVEAHKHNILLKVGADSAKELNQFKVKKRR